MPATFTNQLNDSLPMTLPGKRAAASLLTVSEISDALGGHKGRPDVGR
jgi:hypothetical protein